MRRCLWVSLLGFGAGLCLPLQAAIFHVAQAEARAEDHGPGTLDQPWKTVRHAAEQVAAGDRVIIHDGVYREAVVVKASGSEGSPIVFETAPGAHVVLTGADALRGWQPVGERPVFRVAWPHRFIGWNQNMTHPDDPWHRLIGRCEQVAVDGYLLRQVLAAGQLAPGAFFVDVTNRTLEVWDAANRDLNHVLAEASVRQELLRVEGDAVRWRGVRFRFAANMAQHGAVVLAGRQDVLEDCVIEQMNASGATLQGPDQVVRRCVFRDNGQLGFGGNGAHHLLVTECLIENNNTKGFDRGWEAGALKLVLCRGAVLEHSRFLRNRGHGIWFDIGNEDGTVRQNLIADNEDCGIFYEISFGLRAQDNVIVGNGFAETGGGWGARAGITLSSSPGGVIERNLIVGNREGFNFREQNRSTSRIGDRAEHPVWNHDQLIRRNVLAYNRDAQVWGWFDLKGGRPWPAAGGPPKAGTEHRPAGNADAYAAKGNAGPPPGSTLESLKILFEENVYFAGPGQAWFHWGVTWGRHQAYPGLAEFQTALGIDRGGRVLDPGFRRFSARDFRVSAERLRELEVCYPRGPVPGVLLGMAE